jgi:hypothetical protein
MLPHPVAQPPFASVVKPVVAEVRNAGACTAQRPSSISRAPNVLRRVENPDLPESERRTRAGQVRRCLDIQQAVGIAPNARQRASLNQEDRIDTGRPWGRRLRYRHPNVGEVGE